MLSTANRESNSFQYRTAVAFVRSPVTRFAPTSRTSLYPALRAIETHRYLPAWPTSQPSWITTIELLEQNLNEAQAWVQSGLLDRGEAEALALAQQLNAHWFLTDDTAARVLAESLGIETHGSLGLLLWAVATKRVIRDEAEQKLDALAASSLWISATVLAEAKAALDRLSTRGEG